MTCLPNPVAAGAVAADGTNGSGRSGPLGERRAVSARDPRPAPRARARRGVARALRTLLCVALLGALGPAAADLRVLLAFDGDGHRVHRVVRVGPVAPDPSRAAPRWKREPSGESEARAGEATLRWLDAAGATLALEHVPDPRLVHVPLGAERPAGTPPIARAALREGSWMASGPDRAATLVLSLPGRAAPPLAPGEWTFELRR